MKLRMKAKATPKRTTIEKKAWNLGRCFSLPVGSGTVVLPWTTDLGFSNRDVGGEDEVMGHVENRSCG
jgi:hypothetical protein